MIVAVTVECSPFSAVLSFHTKGTLICGLHANVGNKTGRGEEKRQNKRVSQYVWAKNVVLLTGQSLAGELYVR